MLGALAPLSHITPKQWQQVMDLNVTANWRLLRILDPLLQQASQPRVAFVTSGVARLDAPYWGAYATSKSALEMLVRTYAAEQGGDMRVNLIDPGIVATDMRARAFPGENPQTLTQPDDPALTDLFVRAMQPDCPSHGDILRMAA
jgi:NAD(P)-dependent dehydrogenase (short-subunit alcohol dehydrogenase family)